MRLTPAITAIAVLLTTTACVMEDAGPTQTATDAIDLGKAETVHTEIHMGAGTLKLEGGAASLMTGSYRFSEKIGRPVARYDVTGASGRLTLNSPKGSSSKGNNVNEWDVRMSSDVPMDLTVALGAGESTLDASHIQLRSLEVDMGAGEMSLNVAGKYTKDVSMQVNGGVGEAKSVCRKTSAQSSKPPPELAASMPMASPSETASITTMPGPRTSLPST